MIFGIGTDIVEIERINNMNSLDGFVKKILSKNEKQFFENLKDIKKNLILDYFVSVVRY